MSDPQRQAPDPEWLEEQAEWKEALRMVRERHGALRVQELLDGLRDDAVRQGVELDVQSLRTPYRNTIPVAEQPSYPGDEELEERLENLVRWNAMAMVLQGNDRHPGLGGHIATYASASTMLEVGFCHFFRGRSQDYGGDLVNVQAHASPGVYARAFLENRLSQRQLENFRQETQPGGGLSSYPHPRRMDDFWQAPTASMGLSTVSSIYQARFARYLENRGLKPRNGGRVWTFIGDGEADEPEVIGTLQIAARERLDNLVLAVNCNLQRLDGPVRGNGKVIQELEGTLRGAGWHVIKVVWGGEWDALLERDDSGVLQRRMDEVLDGEYQRYSVMDGRAVREHWVQGDDGLADIMKTLSDETIRTIKRGGHDRRKIYAAFDRALRAEGQPTAILFKTIKGYGLGEAAEGQNTAHQKKKMSTQERRDCARRFGIPLTTPQIDAAEFYLPPEDSAELQYLRDRRAELGGCLPRRDVDCPTLQAPSFGGLQDLLAGSGERQISSTMALVRMLGKLLRDPTVGPYLVPIVADEARTFGMDGLFRQAGIYSPDGQRYTPVDADTVMPYRESVDGQILQEGICEAGALASFIAAGTAYANYGVPTIPFYIFYSIFGFQRVGDLIWAAADQLCRGFLIGGTAGRTTLNGEGLQHQDGHSQLVALTVPCLQSYDPAFGFEIAVIVREGIRRMYQQHEDVFYYLTAYNENLSMPAMPGFQASADPRSSEPEVDEAVQRGILGGVYRFRKSRRRRERPHVHLLGSGALIGEVLRAAEVLAGLGVGTDIWSVTSYSQLHREATEVERWNRLHPAAEPRVPFVTKQLSRSGGGPFVAVSDYQRALPDVISRWVPGRYLTLGTDGFGVSESRAALRRHFEVDAEHIAAAAISGLCAEGTLSTERAAELHAQIGVDPDAVSAATY